MKDSWYVKTTGGVTGPFSQGELSRRLESGRLLPDTQVRYGIGGAWRELWEVLTADVTEGADSSEAARLALQGMHPRPTGGGSQRKQSVTSSPFDETANVLSQLAQLLGDLFGSVAGWVWTHTSLRGVLFAALLIGVVLVVRASPLMDASLSRAFVNVDLIWLEAEGLRASAVQEHEWEEFEARSLSILKPLSESLTRVNERPPGVWELIWGPNESEIEARHDLLHLARNELPASLATGLEGSEPHDARIEVSLDRLRDYHDGQNPYGLDERLETLPTESPDEMWVSIIVGMDVIIVCGSLCAWWWMRLRRR